MKPSDQATYIRMIADALEERVPIPTDPLHRRHPWAAELDDVADLLDSLIEERTIIWKQPHKRRWVTQWEEVNEDVS